MPTIVLASALVINALMAGLYFGFSTSVMPGLARTDPRSYVTAMQRIDESIENPRFLAAFTGALVLPIVAVFLHFGSDGGGRLPWIVLGAVLYGATVVITGAVNLPLNRRLRTAGAVTDQNAPAIRAAYHDRWTRFNTARTALCTAAVIALTVALAQPLA
ncbi:Uncharacterized membrane protein [Glycomyces sambucus]|uniref:Uncharacterized membrane protein n=1 Tax=Glycomyces sambucus TaxID=380244 RepID=A0A1G9K8P0_9ACTN|nr:anthrone oxygenase family protein [Glycomyces sambucus]SDL46111.1 Uncharacterized membrane protein [Glycomyces sambucus]